MQKRLEVGQIVNTFGIKGEVKVTPFTDDINRFDDLKKVYVKTRKEDKLYKVDNVRYHKNMVLLRYKKNRKRWCEWNTDKKEEKICIF